MIIKHLQLCLLLNIAGTVVLASEATHHTPSVFDLIWPAVNLIILFSLMIYKLKTPIRKVFQEKKTNIQSLFNHTAEKYKDAEMKLEMYEEKLGSLEKQSKKVFEDAKIDVLKFEHDTQEENVKLLDRFNREAKDKIEHEQQQIVHNIGAELLSVVIAKTKLKIFANGKAKLQAIQNYLLSMV